MLWSKKVKHNFTFEYQTTTHPSTTQNSFITTANLASSSTWYFLSLFLPWEIIFGVFQEKFTISGGIWWGIYASKFATITSKLFQLVANCSEQTANQNTNIAAEVCKVAHERTSSLTVMLGLQFQEPFTAHSRLVVSSSTKWWLH